MFELGDDAVAMERGALPLRERIPFFVHVDVPDVQLGPVRIAPLRSQKIRNAFLPCKPIHQSALARGAIGGQVF